MGYGVPEVTAGPYVCPLVVLRNNTYLECHDIEGLGSNPIRSNLCRVQCPNRPRERKGPKGGKERPGRKSKGTRW